jgi:hypothetical protein
MPGREPGCSPSPQPSLLPTQQDRVRTHAAGSSWLEKPTPRAYGSGAIATMRSPQLVTECGAASPRAKHAEVLCAGVRFGGMGVCAAHEWMFGARGGAIDRVQLQNSAHGL